MKKMMITMLLIGVLLIGYGCNKEKPIDPSEREEILEVEKSYITSIIENNRDSFLKCYASDSSSQTYAIHHYDFFTLYRNLYLSVTSKFGEEGWEKYQSFEYGGGNDISQMSELKLEDIDEYVQNARIDFKGGKAILITPENITRVYRKINGNWVIDMKDNPKAQWSEDFAQKERKAYQAAIEESENKNSTIKSIKNSFQDALGYIRD